MPPIAALLASVVVAVLLAGSGSTAHRRHLKSRSRRPRRRSISRRHRGARGWPNRFVTLQVRSTDAKGDIWASRATLRSDSAGTVDLDHRAALSGSYTEVDPMGMIGP